MVDLAGIKNTLCRVSDRVRPKMGNCAALEGQLCGKNYQLCSKLCDSQFFISHVFGGC